MIFTKIISSVIIIMASTMLGVQRAKRLSDREYILREFVAFLSSVENEIKYMLTILPNAYEISRAPLKTKLKDAIGFIVQDMLEDGRTLMVENSINKHINEISELENYDKVLIISTLKNLGMTNVDGQINIIQNTIKNVENQINEAVYMKNKSSRLYRTIGALCGIMLVIIFV